MNFTKKQVVDHYGIHRSHSDGVWWLMQQSGGQTAIGLPSSQCPFRMKTTLLMCPHDFNFKEALTDDDIRLDEYRNKIQSSGMLRAFDPVTPFDGAKCIYIETEFPADYYPLILLQNLLSNPKTNLSNSVKSINDMEIVQRRLRASNLSSYIVYGFDQKISPKIHEFAELSINVPGKLILVGQRVSIPDTSVMKKIKFDALQTKYIERLGVEGLRAIGCARLKQFMRV